MPQPLSYEQLAELVVELSATIKRLEARVAEQDLRIAELEAENAELRRRVGMNSRNSSKPPSSDGPEVGPKPKSLRDAQAADDEQRALQRQLDQLPPNTPPDDSTARSLRSKQNAQNDALSTAKRELQAAKDMRDQAVQHAVDRHPARYRPRRPHRRVLGRGRGSRRGRRRQLPVGGR